jgi:hypothetical protein
METDPVSETLHFPVFKIPDNGQSPETVQIAVSSTLFYTLASIFISIVYFYFKKATNQHVKLW